MFQGGVCAISIEAERSSVEGEVPGISKTFAHRCNTFMLLWYPICIPRYLSWLGSGWKDEPFLHCSLGMHFSWRRIVPGMQKHPEWHPPDASPQEGTSMTPDIWQVGSHLPSPLHSCLYSSFGPHSLAPSPNITYYPLTDKESTGLSSHQQIWCSPHSVSFGSIFSPFIRHFSVRYSLYSHRHCSTWVVLLRHLQLALRQVRKISSDESLLRQVLKISVLKR